jgi:hypothetical protein
VSRQFCHTLVISVAAAFVQPTNISTLEQQWQLYPFDTIYYVLRSHGGGANGFLHASGSSDVGSLPGNTISDMKSYTRQDDSIFCQITAWKDGTFYMTNKENGTDWHIQILPNGWVGMSSNITAPQSRQRFGYKAVGKIDDSSFSSVPVYLYCRYWAIDETLISV